LKLIVSNLIEVTHRIVRGKSRKCQTIGSEFQIKDRHEYSVSEWFCARLSFGRMVYQM